MRVTGTLLVMLAAHGAAGASAQPTEESDELRALRMIERELFGEAGAEPTAPRLGEPPPALTSSVPRPTAAPAVGAPDLEWLQGLRMPDMPVRWDERVVRFLEFFRNDARGRTFIQAWFRRERLYGGMIRETLRRMQLPEDLLYVAMVESGFDPRAQSHAAAVGMWQFVEATGAEYGLERNHWVDERMDPVEATEAGARYLGDLHRRFGSWELALAAYNMGFGALLRSIRKYNTNDYWLLTRLEAGLPFETTLYVAKIMACAIVGRNPERFGITELEMEAPLEFSEVRVPGGTPLSRVAQAAGVEVEAVERLNTELRRGRTPPGGEYVMRIPSSAAAAFAAAWTRMRPREPAHRPYVVRFGERLTHVARRFQTTSRALRSLNELEDDADVGAGDVILVPAVEPHDPPAEEEVVVAVPSGGFRYPDRRRLFYRVIDGDSLEAIAAFFGVSLDDLRRWNNVSAEAALQPGMVMQIFAPATLDLARAVVLAPDDVRVLVLGTEEFFRFHEGQNGRIRFRYRVREGDTLGGIAERFGVRRSDLARINRFARNSRITVGQQLVIYAAPERVPAHLRPRAEAGREPTSAAAAPERVAETPPETPPAEPVAPEAGAPDPAAPAQPLRPEPSPEGTRSEPTPDATTEPTPDATTEPTPDATTEPTPDARTEPTPDATSPDEAPGGG